MRTAYAVKCASMKIRLSISIRGEVPANLVPAAAVIRGVQALLFFTGFKRYVGG
jgi:hypothetical protein